MPKNAKPRKARSPQPAGAVTVDDITTQVNGLTLRWIAFHRQLHPQSNIQTIPWIQARLDDRTSRDWSAQIADAHAENCKHCRVAIAAHHPPPNPFDPDPQSVDTDEQGYLNSISNWLTTDVNMFAALWGLYFPSVQAPNPTLGVGTPSTIHEAFDWLALNGNDFIKTENNLPPYRREINLKNISDPPARPSSVPISQSLQTIERACHSLARYHSDIFDVLKHSLLIMTEKRNEKRKKREPFGIK